jgi:HD-GYP domain-containing protein (c-di-GMP phosphodiesterase class II)
MRIGANQSAALGDATRESIQVLQEVLSAHRQGLVQDYLRVAELCRETARSLGLAEGTVVRIELAGRLHDIGKVAIPDAILEKPGPLTRKEWELMRTHTEIGARIIGAAPALGDVAEIVRCHHERFDGSGYPDGLRGDRIPIGASILGVCDSFVAMMRNRSYIDGITVMEALAELRRCSGTQFDPRVVEAFERAFRELFVAA